MSGKALFLADKMTDWQCVAKLRLEPRSLDSLELYKACSALSNGGTVHEGEAELRAEARALLDTRRILRQGEVERARQRLIKLKASLIQSQVDAQTLILGGDCDAVLAIAHHQKGDLSGARRHAQQAIQAFSETGDAHRTLRARINLEIFRNELSTFVEGDLVSFEQLARRMGYFDLVGNIQKGRVVQLMNEGRFDEALSEALEADQSYLLDGCPLDRAIALCLLAILQLIAGRIADAQITIGKVHLRGGRVAPYLEAYETLVAGKVPQPPKGHPLDGTQWPIHRVKQDSVSGRILRRLSQGPVTRDELIAEVWGPNAMNPSYCARLYTAINQLRRKDGKSIVFDGSHYRLNSTNEIEERK